MSGNEKQLMFSLVTGEMYNILSDELKTANEYQVPLKREPKSSCKKCYGRFHVGRNINHNLYIMCPSCSLKCIDMEKVKTLVVASNNASKQT